jgi:hypothetical protein
MRTRVSTTVDEKRLASARRLTGMPDSELIDLALATLLEQAERQAENRALADSPYEADVDLTGLPAGWPVDAPALDAYDGDVPADVLELFAARRPK